MSGNNSILDDLKYQLRHGKMFIKLVLINLIVFVVFHLVQMFFFLGDGTSTFETVKKWIYLPASPLKFIQRPWTLFSYMFLHEGIWHIIRNLLWLYWLGRILNEYTSNRRILAIYLLGGVVGGLFYMLAYNLFPVFAPVAAESRILGASASVMAIVLAAATLLPNYSIHLLILGPIKLKYIALVAIILDIVLVDQSNPGGHIAHLGGAFFGWLFIYLLNRGHDLSAPIGRIQDWQEKRRDRKSKLKVVHKKTSSDISSSVDQNSIDAILDKLIANGNDINALTKKEREILNRASKDK